MPDGADSPVLDTPDDAKPSPGGVDSTDVVVDEPPGQGQSPHHVVGDVGVHTGRAFGPGDPEPPSGHTMVARRSNRRSSSVERVTKSTTMSARPVARRFTVTPSGSSKASPSGPCSRATTSSVRMPSLVAR